MGSCCYSRPLSRFCHLIKLCCLLQSRDHQPCVISIHCSELCEREGIHAESCLYSIARSVVLQNEPILITGIAALVRDCVQKISADLRKRLPNHIAVRRFYLMELPIDNLPLRMIGKN